MATLIISKASIALPAFCLEPWRMPEIFAGVKPDPPSSTGANNFFNLSTLSVEVKASIALPAFCPE